MSKRAIKKKIDFVAEALNAAMTGLGNISIDACDDDTVHALNNVHECVEMAQKFLAHIDTSQYEDDRNGEHIAVYVPKRRKKKIAFES